MVIFHCYVSSPEGSCLNQTKVGLPPFHLASSLSTRNVQLIFARATCIKRAQKRVVYEGANVSGEMEYDEFLAALQE